MSKNVPDGLPEALSRIAKFAEITLRKFEGTHERVTTIKSGIRELPPLEKDGHLYYRCEYDGRCKIVIDVFPKGTEALELERTDLDPAG